MGHGDNCDSSSSVCMTYTEAKRVARRVRRRTKEPVSEYHHAECKWWHVGTVSKHPKSPKPSD